MNKKIIKISLGLLLGQNFLSSCDGCNNIILERVDKNPSTPKQNQEETPPAPQNNDPGFKYPKKKLGKPYKKKKIQKAPTNPGTPEVPTDDEENIEDGTNFVANNKILNDFLDRFPIMREKLSKKLLEIIDSAESLEDQFHLFGLMYKDTSKESVWKEHIEDYPGSVASIVEDIFLNEQCKKNVKAILASKTEVKEEFSRLIFLDFAFSSNEEIVNAKFSKLIEAILYVPSFEKCLNLCFSSIWTFIVSKKRDFLNPDILGLKDTSTNIFINIIEALDDTSKLSCPFFREILLESPAEKVIKFRNAFMGTKEEVQNIIHNIDHVLNYRQSGHILGYDVNKRLETSRQFILLDKCVDLIKKYNKDQAWLLFTYLHESKLVEDWKSAERSGEDALNEFVKKVDSRVKANYKLLKYLSNLSE